MNAEMDSVVDSVHVVTCSSPAQLRPNNCSVEISSDRQNWLRAGWFEYRDTIRVDGKSGKCSFIVVQKTDMYAKNVETWYREAVFKFASIISSVSHNTD